MQDSVAIQILWVASGVTTLVAALLVGRKPEVRYLARAAVGLLFLVGGALLHVVNLATDLDYADFADPAHFAWVTDTWREAVGPNQLLYIGLLVAFETTVGVLALVGGRATAAAYAGIIAFYLALCLFGWIEVVWAVLMVPAMVLLLRAELRAERAPRSPVAPPPATRADVHGSTAAAARRA